MNNFFKISDVIRRHLSRFCLQGPCLAMLLVVGRGVQAETPPAFSSEQLHHFETSIRPLLVTHCRGCHGPAKQEAGLRLDSREGLLKGGDSGPVINFDAPEASRIITVMRYLADDIQMPPAGARPTAEIDLLIAWIRDRAPWPVTEVATSNAHDLRNPVIARQHHWALRPISTPAIPHSVLAPPPGWTTPIYTEIDSFIDAALAKESLSRNPEADRRTLARRVAIDLTGLAPTFEQLQQFEQDPSRNAYEEFVDRLLASPAYGERWARHWLDVARYADTKGYVFTEDPRYPNAYTYRDYVINAFNNDLPYDQFIKDQLAADMLHPENSPPLAALGFLTVGRRFLNNQFDIADDRIDVICRGLMGLSVGCARCHDHKFDPIPTADYYSLQSVMLSIQEPTELPIIGECNDQAAAAVYRQERQALLQKVTDFEASLPAKLEAEVAAHMEDYLKEVAKLRGWTGLAAPTFGEPREPVIHRWRELLDQTPADHPVWGPWRQMTETPNGDFSQAWSMLLQSWEQKPDGVSPVIRQALVDSPPTDVSQLAARYGQVFASIYTQWQTEKGTSPAGLANPAEEAVRVALMQPRSPVGASWPDARNFLRRTERDELRNLNNSVTALASNSPGAPMQAMVVRDKEVPWDGKIFLRGNPGRPGPAVPRQFLEVLSTENRTPFGSGSGRLELANAVASPANPLTPRVIVNRLWQQHFGSGIVTTGSDFGVRGAAPSHPELLDYLAARLIDSGWSLKSLHRLIVTSGVYRQASHFRPDAANVDPENRLLWRMPRQRMSLEAFRDSVLAVAGRLDQRIGGKSADDLVNPDATRRTLYCTVNRNELPGVYRVFDFADPDSSSPGRPQTTVPQQMLFLMNSPLMARQAERVAESAWQQAAGNGKQLVTLLYRRILARDPTQQELADFNQFLESVTQKEQGSSEQSQLSPLAQLAQVLLMTNEFSFVD
jgi:Protein of unknown function (DUF1553)/Protein of unknown function (DUF1549)/Planctomycete cytochrome C